MDRNSQADRLLIFAKETEEGNKKTALTCSTTAQLSSSTFSNLLRRQCLCAGVLTSLRALHPILQCNLIKEVLSRAAQPQVAINILPPPTLRDPSTNGRSSILTEDQGSELPHH
ncbi:unnamed protein product, partial [Iphiclides podalirius]